MSEYNSKFSGEQVDERLEKAGEIDELRLKTIAATDVKIVEGFYYNAGGYNVGDMYSEAFGELQGAACTKQPVVEGDIFEYSGQGSNYVRSFVVVNSSGVITKISPQSGGRVNSTIVIEKGDEILYASFNNYNAETDYLKKGKYVNEYVTDLSEDVYNQLGSLDSTINPKAEIMLDSYFLGRGYNVGDVFPADRIAVAGLACTKVSVREGEKYIYSGEGSDYVIKYIITGRDNIIKRISTTKSRSKEEITIEEGEMNMYVSFNSYNAETDYLKMQEGMMRPIKEEIDGLSNTTAQLVDALFPKVPITTNKYYSVIGYSVGSVYPGQMTDVDGLACARVEVKAGDKYVCSCNGGTEYVRMYITVDSSNIIKRIAPTASRGVFEISIEPDEVVMYVSFAAYNPETDYLQLMSVNISGSNTLPLQGKKIVCFGDSITEFSGAQGRYSDFIASITGATVINVGIGGTQIRQRANATSNPTDANQGYAGLDIVNLVKAVAAKDYSIPMACAEWLSNNVGDNNVPIVERLMAIDWSTVDAVTFFAGTNDFIGGQVLGSESSTSASTTLGAINTIITTLLTAYPHLKIYWFTPIVRWMASSLAERTDENWSDNYTNTENKTLPDYVASISTTVKKWHLPVCDMYWELGINKVNFSQYFNDSDGVHPYKGFEEIGKKMASFIIANNII